MGKSPATEAIGPSSSRRLHRPTLKITLSFTSVVAVALGTATLLGQATSSAAGRLAASPVAQAKCSASGTANQAVVDLNNHQSFARLRTVCVGTLDRTGVIDAGALFVLQDVGPAQGTNTEVVRVDLTTYAVTRSAPITGGFSMFTGFGDLWVLTASTKVSLDQLSPMTLRVLHRFAEPDCAGDFVPFAGRLWFIDNCSLTLNPNSLETLNPTDGRTSVVRLPWLPTGLSASSLTSSGGELYLLAVSQKTPATAIATYNPVSGAHRVVSEVDLGGGAGLLGVSARVLWVLPPGGNMHTVAAYSAQSLRPLTGGFSDGFLNGTWTAVTDAGDLWFQIAGDPLDCVSGKTARVDTELRLPNTFSSQNIAEATPPGFVAADATNLIIAANETHGANPSESGIAVYALDPRCRA
jgi:hypothetical protein